MNDKNKRDKKAVVSDIGRFSAVCIGRFFTAVSNLIKYLLFLTGSFFRVLFKAAAKIISLPVRNLRNNLIFVGERQSAFPESRKKGRLSYFGAAADTALKFFFGENGIFRRFSDVVLPLLSVLFFVGIVRYGTSVEYAVSVECSGHEIGTVSDESVFNEALEIAENRITFSGETANLDISTKYQLKMFNDKSKFMSAHTLANEIISNSGSEVTQAYGVYVNDEFVGAVMDKTEINNALAQRLSEYKTMGTDAVDIQYKDAVIYEEGLYLSSSVFSADEMKTKLFSKETENTICLSEEGDTLPLIAAKYNMSLIDIKQLNKGISETDPLPEGTAVYVTKTKSFLPVQYVRTIDRISYISYKTEMISTPSLSAGESSILVKGERGEKLSKVQITYLDGIETYSETISTVISKKPVNEQIGVGTFHAYPEDSSIVLTGTGQFMWPVNGGYISDTFMSGRIHKGIDIAANEGTEIYAADAGTVIASGWNAGGYGYMVMVDHGNGYQTLYAHCSSLTVHTGESVLAGEIIARVGSTGSSTGNHLHFEVRHDGMCYNPLNFLSSEQ